MISQREARRLRKRVAELERVLEQQRSTYVREWPLGVHIGRLVPDASTASAILTARKLGHAVVCTAANTTGQVDLFALQIPRLT